MNLRKFTKDIFNKFSNYFSNHVSILRRNHKACLQDLKCEERIFQKGKFSAVLRKQLFYE